MSEQISGIAGRPPLTPPPPGMKWGFNPTGQGGPNGGMWSLVPDTSVAQNFANAGQTVGETFADAATGGGYTAIAGGLGHDSKSMAAPLIEGTPIGDINRKAATLAAGQYGIDLGLKDPNAPAGTTGGAGGAAGAGDIDQAAKDIYGKAMENAGRSYTAGTIDSRDVVDPGIAPATQVTAAGRAPVTGYAAEHMTGPLAAEAAQAQATDPTGAIIDRRDSDNLRSRQEQNLNDLELEATGQGIGAQQTKARLNAALARVNNDTFAAAGAARGAGRTGLQREAMLQGSRNGLEAALKGEELGLTQQLSARQQMTNALQGTRGQDIDLAGEQARLTQQADIVRAQLRTAVSQGNAVEINRLNAQLRDLEQQTKSFNAGATNDASKFGAAAANTADLDLVGRTDTVGLSNAGRTDTRAIAAGTQAVNVQTGNANRALDADKAQEDANRGAFDSTTTAGTQGLAGANQAVGNRVDLIHPTTEAKSAADATKARNNEMLLEGATGVITAIGSRKPPAPAPAPTVAPDNGLMTPKFAAFGGVTDGPTIAGEAGPELVIPIKDLRGRMAQALAVQNKPADQPLDMDSNLAEQLISRVFRSRKGRAA